MEVSMTKIFRFGAVYGAPPIFNPDLDQMGYIEASELPLSASLISDIDVWNQTFQETFFEDYPPDSGFDSLEKMVHHNVRGTELALLLQRELGRGVVVQFIPLK
jgi:hypothetical protein